MIGDFMVGDILSFLAKVLVASLVLSVAIKYGGPMLGIPATPVAALIGVLSPTVIVAIALGWRLLQDYQGS
jgi:hypothetical protein